MKRPSFQFYPGDWRTNAKLGRCSKAARGCWMDILCVLHDEDEYGIARYPLAELARAASVPIKLARELADKGVLKGGDEGCAAFIFIPRHAGQGGEPVTLILETSSPVWFSSRFVRDEFIRGRRGKTTQFSSENQPPKQSPIPPIGERQGDGPSSSSSSQKEVRKNLLNGFVVGKKNGAGQRGPNGVTIQDPEERLARFQKSLAESFPQDGWSIVAAAADHSSPDHKTALALCKRQARAIGKGWPQQWSVG